MANNWNFETTANKNVLAVDYTDIAVELSARIALRLRNLKPMVRRLAGEVERQIVELRSTTATSPYMSFDHSTTAKKIAFGDGKGLSTETRQTTRAAQFGSNHIFGNTLI